MRGAHSGIVPHDGACQSGSVCGRLGRCGGGLQEQKAKKKRRELAEEGREGRLKKKVSKANRLQ